MMVAVQWLLAGVMVMQGIGHVIGFLAAWTKIPVGWRGAPWLFGKGYTISSPIGMAWGLVWLVVLVGFAEAGLGLMIGQSWWLAMAVASALISLVAILPWWKSVPVGAAVGAIAVDLVVLWLATPLGMSALTRIA